MTKIMLVEDDNSLREIYSIRLTAEGYTIVAAGDGEEALAMAVRERPDLIISDVMMPKISGFDMLDILRSTPETKDIRVIMMTALSSEDQRNRGENLGADRYLVKSQVGIEDVVNAVHEVLGDRNTDGTINASVNLNETSQNVPQPAQQGVGQTVPQASPIPVGPAQGMPAQASSIPPMPAPVAGAPIAPNQIQASEQVSVGPQVQSEAPAVPEPASFVAPITNSVEPGQPS